MPLRHKTAILDWTRDVFFFSFFFLVLLEFLVATMCTCSKSYDFEYFFLLCCFICLEILVLINQARQIEYFHIPSVCLKKVPQKSFGKRMLRQQKPGRRPLFCPTVSGCSSCLLLHKGCWLVLSSSDLLRTIQTGVLFFFFSFVTDLHESNLVISAVQLPSKVSSE